MLCILFFLLLPLLGRAEDTGQSAPIRISSVRATPSVLSNPDRRVVPVSLSVAATADTAVECKLAGITANQRLWPGDAKITGPLGARLKAATRPSRAHRVYTLRVRCTDAAGLVATRGVTVTVVPDVEKRIIEYTH